MLVVGCSWFGGDFSVLTFILPCPWVSKSFTFVVLLVAVISLWSVSVVLTVLT